MSAFRWIVGFALLPRALHTLWILLLGSGVALVASFAAAESCASGVPPESQATEPGALELVIANKTAEPGYYPLEHQEGYYPLEQGQPPAEAVCFASDVKQLCCPSACAVKSSLKWAKADEVLRACMRSIGCSDGESKSATVFSRCNCGRVKP